METGKVINRISNRLRRRSAALQETLGMSGAQGNILNFILVEGQKHSIYQKDIEEKFCVTRSTVSKVLKGMESKGLLRRESVSSDARLKRLVLTEEGREINANAAVERIELENRIRDGLSDEEFHTLMHLLKRVADNMLEE